MLLGHTVSLLEGELPAHEVLLMPGQRRRALQHLMDVAGAKPQQGRARALREAGTEGLVPGCCRFSRGLCGAGATVPAETPSGGAALAAGGKQ